MQGAAKSVLAWSVVACTGAGAVAPASGAISVSFASTPNPVKVQEGNPGAIKWTLTNTSTATTTGENINIVIDSIVLSSSAAMVFVGGDREDEAYNPRIENPGTFVGYSLLPGATVPFNEFFDSRDLGNTIEPDEGLWDTVVRVNFHAAGDPTTNLFELSHKSRIHVQDPNFPEPGSLAVLATAVCASTRRVRKAAA